MVGSKTHGKRNDCWQGQRKPRPRPEDGSRQKRKPVE